MHMLKLPHLVDDKMHARSTARTAWSPSSRWAARRSSAVSASVRWRCGRWKRTARPTRCRRCSPSSRTTPKGAKVYESIVKGDHRIEAGMPESFNVLVKEIRSLAIDIDLDHNRY